MTEEIKNSASEATDVETQEEVSEIEESEEESSEEPSKIDYKAELEIERKRREKAENAIEKYKREAKEVKTEPSEENDIASTLREIVKQEIGVVTQTLQGQELTSAIKNVSSNDDEAEAIRYHLENTVKPSGDRARDIQRAKIIANESRLLAREEELSAMKKPGKGGGASIKKNTHAKPELSSTDQRILETGGYEWDAQKGVYTNGGKFDLQFSNGQLNQVEAK